MNAFVRQLAVLSVLWALCEMILPGGKQQQMVRMTVSVLVMTALLSTASSLLKPPYGKVSAALAQQAAAVSQADYRRTALTAWANQAENYCMRLSQRAGYEARAAVYLTPQGAIDHITLQLKGGEQALMPIAELQQTLAAQLCIRVEQIAITASETEDL